MAEIEKPDYTTTPWSSEEEYKAVRSAVEARVEARSKKMDQYYAEAADKAAIQAFRPKDMESIDIGYFEETAEIIKLQKTITAQMNPRDRMAKLYRGEDPSAMDPNDILNIKLLQLKLEQEQDKVKALHYTNLKAAEEARLKSERAKEAADARREDLVDPKKEAEYLAQKKTVEHYEQDLKERKSISKFTLGGEDMAGMSDERYTQLVKSGATMKEERVESDGSHLTGEQKVIVDGMEESLVGMREREEKLRDETYKELENDDEYKKLREEEAKNKQEYQDRVDQYNKDMEEATSGIVKEIDAKQKELAEKQKKENIHRLLSDRFFYGPTDPNMPINLIQRMFEEDWNRTRIQGEVINSILDEQWVASRFMVPFDSLPEGLRAILIKSTSHLKFMGTGPGEHVSCNPPPQYCAYGDIRDRDFIYPFLIPEKHADNEIGDLEVGEVKLYDDVSKIAYGTYTTYNDNYALGLGRYYSEAIDDGKQLLYLQFGTPRFNGLLDVLRNSVDYVDACIANEGRLPTAYIESYKTVQLFTFLAAPYISTLSLAVKFLIGDVILGDKPYNYYYMEPQMHLYWSSVNTIINHIATDLGILTPIVDPKAKKTSALSSSKYIKTENRAFFDKITIAKFNRLWPEGVRIIDETTGYIDVGKIMARYQVFLDRILTANMKSLTKKANKTLPLSRDEKKKALEEDESNIKARENMTESQYEQEITYETIVNGNLTLTAEEVKKYIMSTYRDAKGSLSHWVDDVMRTVDNEYENFKGKLIAKSDGSVIYNDPLKDSSSSKKDPTEEFDFVKSLEGVNKWVEVNLGSYGKTVSKVMTTGETLLNVFYRTTKGAIDELSRIDEIAGNYFLRAGAMADAVIRGANQYAVFSVQYTGQSSESFSNSVGEMETGGTIKQIGKSVRAAKFNFQAGQTGIGFVDTVFNGLKDLGMSVVDNVSFGFSNIVRGVLMGAYVDIPKIWQDSDCSFQSVTYTMDLISPYGNTFSRLLDIYIPLSMLLAGALPMRVGKASYTSPFLCSAYSKGVQFVRMGMITDLSITRGITNLPFNEDRQSNGFTVSFTITNFDHMVSAPVNTSVFAKEWFPIIDQNTGFAHYSDLITGKELNDIKMIGSRFGIRFSNVVKSVHGTVSPDTIGSLFGNAVKRSALGGLFRDYIMLK